MEHHETTLRHHPGPRQYATIAVISACLTLGEVLAFTFMGSFTSALVVWIILALAAANFVLLVSVFMHLRFDDWRFTALFVFPLVIMISIVVALIAMFHSLTR